MSLKTRIKNQSERIFDLFLQGLLYTAPIGFTILIIYQIFIGIDEILQKYIIRVLPFKIPGLGIMMFFVLITFFGYFGQSILARQFRVILEKFLKRTPIIEMIYSGLKDFLSAFVGKEKKFTQPVLVRVNNVSNLEKIGFITEENLSKFNIKDKVAVYFPHCYAFSGELYIVPVENITTLNVSPSEAMKFIVSGGISKGK
jgi:uncharacterized membrane protein